MTRRRLRLGVLPGWACFMSPFLPRISFLLLEDDASYLLLEDGHSRIILG